MLLRVRAAGKVGTVYFLKQTWVANEWEGVKDNTTDDQCWKGQSEGRVGGELNLISFTQDTEDTRHTR